LKSDYFSDEEIELLLKSLNIYSPSYGEETFIEFLKETLTKSNIEFETKGKNIYRISNKNMPLLSAHTDSVGNMTDGKLLNFIEHFKHNGEEIIKGIGNIAGDDKCGIFLILLLAKKYDVNFIFAAEEEPSATSKNGISSFDFKKYEEFFSSMPYCLVLDRKGGGDIISQKNGFGTKEFDSWLYDIGKDFGYKNNVQGLRCNATNLKDYICSANLSVGYYLPHSRKEFIVLRHLRNAYDFVEKAINTKVERFPLKEIIREQFLPTNNSMKLPEEFYDYPYDYAYG
jgi:putative aminopeptidase FrvX